jgi:NADH-quinone oxidoreductase subunit E
LNSLLEKYPQEVEAILNKYPTGDRRAAAMPLLYLAQRDGGFVSVEEMAQIAGLLDISTTEVASLVGFYTLFHDHPEGAYRIQVCNDLPCALRGADQFLENLCENLGIQVGGTTGDGKITVESVMCLAACDKAPMFQLQSGAEISYHENQTLESALALIQSLPAGDQEAETAS